MHGKSPKRGRRIIVLAGIPFLAVAGLLGVIANRNPPDEALPTLVFASLRTNGASPAAVFTLSNREHRTLLVQDVAIHVPIGNGWERFSIMPTTAKFEREGIPKGLGDPVPPGDRLQILVAPPKDSRWRIYCQFVREESRFRSLQILARMIWQDGTWKSGGLRKLWSGRVIGEPGQIASDAAPRD